MDKHDMEQLFRDIEEIKRAVIGDTKWGQKGLIRRVDGLESWKDSINLKIAYTTGFVVAIVEILKFGLEYLTTKH